MPRAQTLKGKKFDRLTCIELVTIGGHRKWKCQCECGKIIHATAGNLNARYVKSCGCLKKEYVKGRNRLWSSGLFISDKNRGKGNEFEKKNNLHDTRDG